MHSNSEDQRQKAADISANVSPEQLRPVGDLWKKKTARRWTCDWKRRGMFTYRAHVTIIYQRESKKPKDFDSRLQLGWK